MFFFKLIDKVGGHSKLSNELLIHSQCKLSLLSQVKPSNLKEVGGNLSSIYFCFVIFLFPHNVTWFCLFPLKLTRSSYILEHALSLILNGASTPSSQKFRSILKAPSTRWRIFSKTQLFLSVFTVRPHVDGVFGEWKRNFFENALQGEIVWKRCIHVYMWTAKTELFENADFTIIPYQSNMEKKVIPLMVSCLSILIACL